VGEFGDPLCVSVRPQCLGGENSFRDKFTTEAQRIHKGTEKKLAQRYDL